MVHQIHLLLAFLLFFDGCEPVPVSGTSTTETFAPNTGGLYNNMGVPGAKSFHLIFNGYGNPAGLGAVPPTANPYFVRIASSPNKSVIEDAMAQSPTFFSLWIGNNDVLGYALAGGDPALDAITPTTTFSFAYSTLVNTLTSNGAKGVVGKFPYVTTIPQFTTIPVMPLSPNIMYAVPSNPTPENPALLPDKDETDCKIVYPVSVNDIAIINSLNTNFLGLLRQLLTPFGQADRIQLYSTTQSNPLLITDESLSDMGANITFAAQNSGNPQLVALAPFLGATYGKARHTKTGDLIPLTTKGAIASTVALPPALASFSKRGITYPMEDKYILVSSEIEELKTATDSYNAIIKSLAESKDLAFVDANKLLTAVATTGLTANGFTLKSTYVTGGAFSLDGVHPSPRGYALIANEFIKAINSKYGSNLKGVDLGNYRILFPASLQ